MTNKKGMALVLEEVPELPSESPEEIPKSEKPDTPDNKPVKQPRAPRKVPEAVPEKTDWKEKVPCPGCHRVLSRHTLEFSHKCKGPKKEKPSRVRFEPREEPVPKRCEVHLPVEPEMSHDQMIRLMLRWERERRESVMCAPMRRFYGLQ